VKAESRIARNASLQNKIRQRHKMGENSQLPKSDGREFYEAFGRTTKNWLKQL